MIGGRRHATHCQLGRPATWIRAGPLLVRTVGMVHLITLIGEAVGFRQPHSKVNLLTALTAEWQMLGLGFEEIVPTKGASHLPFGNGAARARRTLARRGLSRTIGCIRSRGTCTGLAGFFVGSFVFVHRGFRSLTIQKLFSKRMPNIRELAKFATTTTSLLPQDTVHHSGHASGHAGCEHSAKHRPKSRLGQIRSP